MTVDLDPDTDDIQKEIEIPNQGTFTADDEGNITFTPEPDFVGEVTIPYTVEDNGDRTSEPANITIEVVNIPPVATNDNASSKLDVPVTFNIVTNDTDSDGSIDPTTVDLDPDTPGVQKTFAVSGQGSFEADAEGNVTFVPESGFVGQVTIPYTVSDNSGSTSNQADIQVTITDVLPFADDDSASTLANQPVSFQIADNDTPAEGEIDPATIDFDPSTPELEKTLTVAGKGTFTVSDAGEVTFTPEPGFVGEVEIPYTVERYRWKSQQ